jgi:hypothetical protein
LGLCLQYSLFLGGALRIAYRQLSTVRCWQSRAMGSRFGADLTLLSTEPRARRFSLLQQPHTMRFGCLPRMGVFLFVRVLYISRFPWDVATASCGPTRDHSKRVGSFKFVSRSVRVRECRDQMVTAFRDSSMKASCSPSASQHICLSAPVPDSGNSSYRSPVRE